MTKGKLVRMDIFTTAQPAKWMSALENCSHDFYHLPQYHALAEWSGEGTALLFHYAEGEYSIALPLLIRTLDNIAGVHPRQDWQDATSVYGYAGPVASHSEVPALVLRNFQERLRERLLEMNIVTVFSRLHPILRQQELLQGLGDCRTLSQTVSIDLTLPVEAQRTAYRSSLKTSLNRLRRNGVTCVHDPDGLHLDTFIQIYHETMTRVGAVPLYFFPREYFYSLFGTLGDRFHLILGMSQGEIVCGGIFIECGGVLQYHLGGTRNAALEFAPMKLLLDEARIWANQRKLRVFHLGGGATARPDDPLLHFKLGFSDRTHDFAVWQWVLQPEAHERMCQQRLQWIEGKSIVTSGSTFFPEYRRPAVQAATLRSQLAAGAVAPAQGIQA